MSINPPSTLDEDDDEFDTEDTASVASREDDTPLCPPERVLAQGSFDKNTFYLIKYKDCPLTRTNWVSIDYFTAYPDLWREWLVEQQRQVEGKSKPFDVPAFQAACRELELAERQRRRLRRLKRRVTRILSVLQDEKDCPVGEIESSQANAP